MSASLYLALAYLKPKRHLLSVINILAVAGTLIGVAVLVIVTSVMNGFGEMWEEKILSFQPHVSVYAYPDGMERDHPLFDEVRALPEVEAVSPFLQTLVVAQHRDITDTPMLRGIDPKNDFLFEKLAADRENTLEEGRFELEEQECLIGIDLARTLGVRTGDTLTVFSPAMFAREDEILLPEDLRVAGIFQVGMWQVDSAYILTDLPTARDVMGRMDGVHGMQVLGTDLMRADELAAWIAGIAGPRFTALSWRQMNQALFNALTMEKGMMFFLLAIISIVAMFLVSSTLIMVSVQKTREIGLLKSMGFRNRSIMGVFMWYGLIQGVFGILLGTGTGLLVLEFRQQILDGMSMILGFEVLPKELYFLDGLPAKTDPKEVARIASLVLGLCLLGGSLPAWLAARKNPVEALRHD